MKKKWIILICVIFATALVSCSKHSTPTGPAQPEDTTRKIVILYTNDEHGWMEATENNGGAAEMMGLWRENEGYVKNSHFLILSGGDLWTGPAISTWFEGESMAEVMNAMHYSAAAIGNHEFDFKVEGLNARLQQSDFPFLAANIREKTTSQPPDFSTPYVIKEVSDVKIGIIGLSSLFTPFTTFPDYVEDYDFLEYANVLNEIVPKVRSDGAELLVVIGHICVEEMQSLAPLAEQLGIAVIGGGHCHQRFAEVVNDVALIESGSYLQAYARVELTFDYEADSVLTLNTSLHDNVGGTADDQIAAIVDIWKARVDAQLSLVIGYAQQSISRYSAAMHNMVADSWLWSFPSANVAVTNRGGIRQDIPAGDIKLETIVGVLPFQNDLIELELTGAQLIEFITEGQLVIGGMTTVGGYKLTDGTPITQNHTYKVITTDFLYAVRGYLATYDPTPNNLSVNYRQPLSDWISSLNTSVNIPLDNFLDTTPRW